MKEFYVVEIEEGKFLKHYSLKGGVELTECLKEAYRYDYRGSAIKAIEIIESNYKVYGSRTRKAIETIELI